jgi:hypothetical protein
MCLFLRCACGIVDAAPERISATATPPPPPLLELDAVHFLGGIHAVHHRASIWRLIRCGNRMLAIMHRSVVCLVCSVWFIPLMAGVCGWFLFFLSPSPPLSLSRMQDESQCTEVVWCGSGR